MRTIRKTESIPVRVVRRSILRDSSHDFQLDEGDLRVLDNGKRQQQFHFELTHKLRLFPSILTHQGTVMAQQSINGKENKKENND